uniref:Cysteine-rich transmembrane domain-containing protein n=1 Tax=Varanus komodoensis TaxID=61221 RepID=A0A8D2JA03_VARKO
PAAHNPPSLSYSRPSPPPPPQHGLDSPSGTQQPGYSPNAPQVCPAHSLPSGCQHGTVYVVEDRKKRDSTLAACLHGCCTALCCCWLWDLMTGGD